MNIRRADIDAVTAPSNKGRVVAVRIGGDEYVIASDADDVMAYAAIRILDPQADPDLVLKGIQATS